MTETRRTRALAPESLRTVWQMLGALLGPRRRRLVAAPFLGLAIAVSETAALLAVVGLLLLLVDKHGHTTLHLFGSAVVVSFPQLAAVAVAGCVLSAAVRVVEARFTTEYQAQAIEAAVHDLLDAWFNADWEQLRTSRLGRLQQLMGVNAQNAGAPVQLVSMGSTAIISLAVYAAIVFAAAPLVAVLFVGIGAISAIAFAPVRRRQRALAQRYAQEFRGLLLSGTSYTQLNREVHVYGVGDAAAASLGDRVSVVVAPSDSSRRPSACCRASTSSRFWPRWSRSSSPVEPWAWTRPGSVQPPSSLCAP